MSLQKDSEIDSVDGVEGTKIKQYFNSKNTVGAISYSIAQFSLEVGKKSKLHKLNSSEIYYVLEGKGELKVDNKIFYLKQNDSVFVKPDSAQQIKNVGPEKLKFLCIVEPEWKPEDEILLE